MEVLINLYFLPIIQLIFDLLFTDSHERKFSRITSKFDEDVIFLPPIHGEKSVWVTSFFFIRRSARIEVNILRVIHVFWSVSCVYIIIFCLSRKSSLKSDSKVL